MEVAVLALIVSALAFAVSIWSAVSSHRSAESAEAVAALDRERRHEELEPRLVAEWEPEMTVVKEDSKTTEHMTPLFRLRNEGPRDYESVGLKMVEPEPNDESSFIQGFFVGPGEHEATATVGPLRVGESRLVQLWMTRSEGGTVRMLCRCRVPDGENWTTLVTLEIPDKPYRRMRYR